MKSIDMFRRTGIAVAVTVASVGATATHAALVENLTIGNAKALALGNAVTADPPGIDSIHYNPAGLTRLQGRTMQLKGVAAMFQFDAEFGSYDPLAAGQIEYWGVGPDEVENSKSSTRTAAIKLPFLDETKEWPLPFLVVPMGGAAYTPPQSNLTFATNFYAPVAAGYLREDDDPGRYMGKYLSVVRFTYLSPSVGWKINDEWSLGFSVGASWEGLGAKTDLRVPNLVLGVVNAALEEIQATPFACEAIFGGSDAEICDDNTPLINPLEKAAELTVESSDPLAWSANFGVLWSPTPWFTWGATYQAESSMSMEGDWMMEYTDAWVQPFSRLENDSPIRGLWKALDLPEGLRKETGEVKMDLIHPAHFATGISVKVLPELKLNFDVKWTDWEKWEGLNLQFDRKTDFLRIASLIQPEYASDTTLTIPRHYKSVWNWAFGAEYQYTEEVALRIGYEYRNSSAPNHKEDVLLPLGDAQLFGGGIEFKLDKLSILEFAGGYLYGSQNVPAGKSSNANSMDTNNSFIYNPYSGMDFETTAQGLIAEVSYITQF